MTRTPPDWIAAKAFDEIRDTLDDWEAAVVRLSCLDLQINTEAALNCLDYAHDLSELEALEWALRRVWAS